MSREGANNHSCDEMMVVRPSYLAKLPPGTINDGAYLAGLATIKGYRVSYSPDAKVIIDVPTRLADVRGQRLPLIVISPYARENYVSETLLSHLSILHYIEYNWKLKPLNSAVAQANLPLDLFYFNTQPRPPLILNSTGPYSYKSYPVPLQIPLEHLEYKRSGSLINTQDQYLVPTLDIATIAIIVASIIYIISTRFEQRKRTSARRKM